MKNIYMFLFILFLFNIHKTTGQSFEFKTLDLHYAKVKPVLDGIEDDIFKTEKQELLDRWNGNIKPMDGHSGWFRALYDSSNFYIFAHIVDADNTAPEDEIGFAINYDMDRTLTYSWENEPKTSNGYFFTKIQRLEKDKCGEGKPIRRTYYKFIETTEGYDVEMRLAWNEITSTKSKFDAFLVRKTFLFDVSVKNNNDEAQYFAWCNDDHSSWRANAKLGTVTLISNTTAINDTPEKEIEIFPNPVLNILNIKNIKSGSDFEICNISGQKIMKGSIENNSMDLSRLKSGIYFIKIYGKSFFTKLIVKD